MKLDHDVLTRHPGQPIWPGCLHCGDRIAWVVTGVVGPRSGFWVHAVSRSVYCERDVATIATPSHMVG